MKENATFLFGLLLSGVLFAQYASTKQPAPAKMPSTPAPAFVPLPKDIQCSLQGLSFRSVVGADSVGLPDLQPEVNASAQQHSDTNTA